MDPARVPACSRGPRPSPHAHERVVGELLGDGGWHCRLPNAVLLLQDKWVALVRKLLKGMVEQAFTRRLPEKIQGAHGQHEHRPFPAHGEGHECSDCHHDPPRPRGAGGRGAFLSLIQSLCFVLKKS